MKSPIIPAKFSSLNETRGLQNQKRGKFSPFLSPFLLPHPLCPSAPLPLPLLGLLAPLAYFQTYSTTAEMEVESCKIANSYYCVVQKWAFSNCRCRHSKILQISKDQTIWFTEVLSELVQLPVQSYFLRNGKDKERYFEIDEN